MTLVLHGAWRSSAAYRVRIGLNLKGLAYETAPVNLVDNQHQGPDFAALNPQKLVPALAVDGQVLTQSLAILEWLDEAHPEPALLPADPLARAQARAMAQIIACDIHPVNNLRILRALTGLGVDEPGRGDYAFGDTPGLVDCCLVPQVYNAERFKTDLTPFPALRAVAGRALQHPAFAAAHPNQQPDAIHA
jgi:glutathione S-transferase